MIAENSVLIDIPEKSIIDIFMDILKNNNRYRFEWEKDFGYTDDYRDFLLVDSHLVQVFNNVLKLDGDTWLLLFQTVALDYPDAYDAKYGEELAMLICTESDKELEATKKQVERWQDLFTEDGKLGQLLSQYSKNLDSEVKAMYQASETILEEVKNGNNSMAVYNRSYQALEKAFDKQTWFSNTGGNILQVQKGISEAVPYLEMAMNVLEVVEYGEEFKNQDEFAIQALLEYLNHSTVESITSKSMLSSMRDYAGSLQSDIAKYSLTRLYQENLDNWISKAFGIKEALGNQANIALLAWGLASDFIPFISNGLSAADKFELAIYANIFQADAFQNYQRYREQIFSDESSLNSQKLYQLSQYCYMYLKSCYITRDAALGSLKNKIGQDELKPLIDYQNSINEEIADKLVVLKNAEKDNKTLVYGFLPDNNVQYLDTYKDNRLVELCSRDDLAIPEVYQEVIEKYIAAFPWSEIDHNSTVIPGLPEASNLYTYYTELSEIGYAVVDIDGNGVVELLIGDMTIGNQKEGEKKNRNSWIMDAYTLVDDAAVHVLESGERWGYNLCSNGELVESWSGSAFTSGWDIYKLDGATLSFIERVVLDGYYAEEIGLIYDVNSDSLENISNSFFYSSIVNNGNHDGYIHISEEEADERIQSYEEKYVDIEYIPFSEYNIASGIVDNERNSVEIMSEEEICRIVTDHYNMRYNTDIYGVWKEDCIKTEEGYFLVLRSTGGNTANIAVADITVDMSSGKVTDDFSEESWNIYE